MLRERKVGVYNGSGVGEELSRGGWAEMGRPIVDGTVAYESEARATNSRMMMKWKLISSNNLRNSDLQLA